MISVISGHAVQLKYPVVWLTAHDSLFGHEKDAKMSAGIPKL